MLQAQLRPFGIDGPVFSYENRECSTPREAEEFRSYFERIHGAEPDQVFVPSLCGSQAVKVLAEVPEHGRGEK